MKWSALLLALTFAQVARADVAMAWSKPAGVLVVAHDKRIEGFDRTGAKTLWVAAGVSDPSAVVVSPDGRSAAVVDAFGDGVVVVTLADGAVQSYEAAGTPVAVAFFGKDLWVVERDRDRVERISPNSDQTDEVAVAGGPSLIAVGEKIYVYSRSNGVLQEIDPHAAKITRSLVVGFDGTDLEIAGAFAYLCRAADGTIVAVDLVTMKSKEFKFGAAPVDLAIVPFGAALRFDPGTFVIADPGRQRIVETPKLFEEAAKSRARTPAPRGRERGTTLGSVGYPTPVDRIAIAGAGVFAFDTNSGVLYRDLLPGGVPVATGITATGFALTDDAVFVWDAKEHKPRKVELPKE